MSIGTLYYRTMQHGDVGTDRAGRIEKNDGKTPYQPGIDLHYELLHPADGDHRAIAFQLGRAGLQEVRASELADLLEHAECTGKLAICPELDPGLAKSLSKLLKRRIVKVNELATQTFKLVIDLTPEFAASPIESAVKMVDTEIISELVRRRVSKKDDVLIYCEDGAQSRNVASELRVNGYCAKYLLGGIRTMGSSK